MVVDLKRFVNYQQRYQESWQCLGFCSADSQANEDQKSAVQKPKRCLTPGFLIPLIISKKLIWYTELARWASKFGIFITKIIQNLHQKNVCKNKIFTSQFAFCHGVTRLRRVGPILKGQREVHWAVVYHLLLYFPQVWGGPQRSLDFGQKKY